MVSVYLYHNGCDTLDAESHEVLRGLRDSFDIRLCGYQEATVAVVGACTFTQQKEDQFKRVVNGILAEPQIERIIVTGCFLTPDHVDPRVVFAKREEVVSIIKSYAQAREDPSPDEATSALVRISEGCYGHCSYCSIRQVRGKHRSRSLSDILNDVANRAKQYSRIRLVGQEISAWGRDLGMSWSRLLSAIYEGFPRLFVELGSMHPRWLMLSSRGELELLGHPNRRGNVHIPLESGSDRVLELMRRGYTLTAFRELWDELEDIGVGPLTTDLIAGFPCESEEDHLKSDRFLRRYRPPFAQVFAFQERPGTPAAQLPQLDWRTRMARTSDLLAILLADWDIETFPPFNTNVLFGEGAGGQMAREYLLRSLNHEGVSAKRSSAIVQSLQVHATARAICEGPRPFDLHSLPFPKLRSPGRTSMDLPVVN